MANLILALDPNTPPETLDRLSYELYWLTRCCVAQNPNTSPETLVRLVNDEDSYVRCDVAWNPNTPQYIKEYLKVVQFMNCHKSNSKSAKTTVQYVG